MPRTFVSAGWPYLYDIPGLHNCVPMLFADVYARFFRHLGDEVFYLCGGDEHGSRIEFVARGLKTTPRALIDQKFEATRPLLSRLGLSFDAFGRSSDPAHGAFVQRFLSRLIEGGRVSRREAEVPWCRRCEKFLPDRFIEGRCPHCGELSYGGQCNNKKSCGRIIEDLADGHCALCSGPIETRPREHLWLPLGPYREQVLPRLVYDGPQGAAVRAKVEETFRSVAESALTRDTEWGIPLDGPAGRSVYSWVDALLAKVSFLGPGREANWWKDDGVRRLFFLGMDGVPFYGALFPALLLAKDEGYSIANWTMLPNEVFIYEGGVCSKSTGTGIWLQEALAVLEPDFWRFYVFHNYARSEKDVDFRWEKFTAAVNQVLLTGLEGSVRRSGAGSADAGRLKAVTDLLLGYDTAGAFRALFDLVLDPGLSRATLVQALPLLACFVPDVTERVRAVLEDRQPRVFDHPPLAHTEIRVRYQDLVDRRRAGQSLAEEITNLRADALCVCPINLKEQ